MTTSRDGQLSQENIVCSLDLRKGRAGRPVTFDGFDDGGAEISSGDEVLKSVPQVAKVLVEPEELSLERDELSNRS
jgi:hypothetical protein